nr:MAG TPA: hypothetical protein [Caudoviricetes sp.]
MLIILTTLADSYYLLHLLYYQCFFTFIFRHFSTHIIIMLYLLSS